MRTCGFSFRFLLFTWIRRLWRSAATCGWRARPSSGSPPPCWGTEPAWSRQQLHTWCDGVKPNDSPVVSHPDQTDVVHIQDQVTWPQAAWSRQRQSDIRTQPEPNTEMYVPSRAASPPTITRLMYIPNSSPVSSRYPPMILTPVNTNC